MSADPTESWKLTLPCTRAEAEAIDMGEGLEGFDPSPVIITSEEIEDDPLSWRLDAYFSGKPDATIVAAVRALAPSSAAVKAKAERVPDEDWITLSQAGIEPVHAARFYVHTSANKGDVPPGAHAFHIEASRAFGTGHHQTTTGCLLALDAMKVQGKRFRNILDLGTGTGLLAFAALHLWPRAYATASDIDAAAISITEENAEVNGIPLGAGPGALALAAAPGLEHPLLIGRAPYDLIVANILAGPLIGLAPTIAMALAEGGTLVLAGLLDWQAKSVTQAYRRQGLMPVSANAIGDWPTLTLRKRARYGAARVTRLGPGGANDAPGFGSW
ncbi:ribonucleotide-diphosphate reductase subunit beta [Sphingomonas panacis]|uniref:Ribosomal protein L11 methyltransferase n=1 Tax=Sphingomonas panacis TaxID=1560345 RepID=A0A1B3Z695_9SPHN|nr:50S ribosomal protein L11 methyltransferase [Sphingomonas panacis]AOH82942.1 ribonucleotide-diphosphate reductase subunit beta [Sphingomonas panacis]